MTVNSKIFSISTLNTIEHGPLTLNIKPHLDPPNSIKLCKPEGWGHAFHGYGVF